MNEEIMHEILDELISTLESMETQSGAILMYLKAQEIVTDAQLKPYLEEAGNASSVRWRAARARIEHLLSAAFKDRDTDKESPQNEMNREGKEQEENKNDAKKSKTTSEQVSRTEQSEAKQPPTEKTEATADRVETIDENTTEANPKQKSDNGKPAEKKDAA